jgi:hypothetical protein
VFIEVKDRLTGKMAIAREIGAECNYTWDHQFTAFHFEEDGHVEETSRALICKFRLAYTCGHR